jgi:hypothetical protein
MSLDPGPPTLDPVPPNPAVTRCLAAFTATRAAAKKQGLKAFDCTCAGVDAYRDLLPPLDSYENIRDFIACVARGIIIDSLAFRDGKDLLYAAHIAISALRAQPRELRSPGRPRKVKNIEEPESPKSEAA